MPTISDPWPHATLDDFLPADALAELLAAIPTMSWTRPPGFHRKAKVLPQGVTDLLTDAAVLDAIRERFGFDGGRAMIELAWSGPQGLKPHCDRKDKLWSGQIYIAGDPKGTEMFDAAGKPAGVIEWRPNRLSCWTRPPQNEMHAAPKSEGRYVLLYWIMRG